jgi:hypothetical protein
MQFSGPKTVIGLDYQAFKVDISLLFDY